ncbi:MAG: glycoside hydrolase family 18 protein [Clostridia bacterium]|nr:glycoside hydrolase family 18 protein [Clostridia bacterium]
MNNSNYKIIGYLAGWEDWTCDTIDASRVTHINYAFALINDGVVSGGKIEKISELMKIKKKFPHLKTMISIGGWEAEGFSDAALTEESRERFADSAVKFMKQYDFDGVDLDWEFPCSSEAGIKSRPEDKCNFTLLLQKVREKLDHTGKADGKHYLLTIATGALKEYVDNMELDKISKILDFINIMTYDFHSGFADVAGHHANLYTSPVDDGDKMSADKAVADHVDAGVPISKLVLGCAFYGRSWNVPNPDRKGLYQPISGGHESYSYQKLISEYINKNGFTRYWDEEAKAPYLWNGERFISYEDEESIGYKVEYIKAKGLGGAMFWEYTQDNNKSLLIKLNEGLK